MTAPNTFYRAAAGHKHHNLFLISLNDQLTRKTKLPMMDSNGPLGSCRAPWTFKCYAILQVFSCSSCVFGISSIFHLNRPLVGRSGQTGEKKNTVNADWKALCVCWHGLHLFTVGSYYLMVHIAPACSRYAHRHLAGESQSLCLSMSGDVCAICHTG